ncbi:hypothetical protein CcaverHIS002_0400860 [Cutaneotrichosporon cavernicola]|uniref:Uncharacterized protein n=1 Tax=Cutaneotrichosporon cavernicola TaxID=279322 RepID=A0AA48QVI7_9TREE|nr:uncharacterized protein CcaverHIS019_0400820 [Cutaneotrichosporon cavernicola]BEI83482.1 hypothetical protein CcaverHIS002_0400860 [Cutaneotrichosporon cavernicola]BEI91262.1 hypothetical protein CcaverHIS019_0400820 [Cutaneotrichosporon cavernicola]BEI99035.1 hypothetical protein CcaverHIS631_0400780 [Cutaneotrichosporon cavernicola]BEJ06809.1 hypothetical protein CcaverHIS641_0400780 [Cutaneotrichosporon cavernicola]
MADSPTPKPSSTLKEQPKIDNPLPQPPTTPAITITPPPNVKKSILASLAGMVLNIILFCIGSFFPETVTKGLVLVPFSTELGITVAARTLSCTAAVVASIALLKLLFGTGPTRANLAQALPAILSGLLASWFWVVGTIVRIGHDLTETDKAKLKSVAGLTAASLGPVLLVYIVLRRGASRA